MENNDFINTPYQCPVCGVPIAFNSAMCSVCKSGIIWNDGIPQPAINGKSAKTFWIITLVILSLAALGFTILALQL
jgi:hypothetical protein